MIFKQKNMFGLQPGWKHYIKAHQNFNKPKSQQSASQNLNVINEGEMLSNTNTKLCVHLRNGKLSGKIKHKGLFSNRDIGPLKQ